MSGARKPIVFISYSHLDEPEKPSEANPQWATFVIGYLRAAFPDDGAVIWIDRLMPGGADWQAEIKRKLSECDVFVLLASHHSLNSDFVTKTEIPAIRKRQKKGEKVHFYPILLTPTPKAALRIVDDKNIRPRDKRPLSGFPAHERQQHIVEAADEIAEIAAKLTVPGANGAAKRNSTRTPEFKGREELEKWLKRQSREVAVAIAARAALRVLPLYRSVRGKRLDDTALRQFTNLTLWLFRASALARVAAKYPTRANELRSATARAAGATADIATVAGAAADAANATAAYANADANAATATAATYAAYAAAAAADAAYVSDRAARAVDFAAHAVRASAHAADAAAVWKDVFVDAMTARDRGATALADAPLWADGAPDWVEAKWSEMHRLMPGGENWEVWLRWYDERLQGHSRSEAYEFAFVDWPDEIWKQGPKVVNARIRESLAALADTTNNEPSELPTAVDGVASPYSFAWTAHFQVASVAGPQNLPQFADYTNPDDHRQALQTAREAAKQAANSLPKGDRNFDVNAYLTVLRAYLRQLPKSAGIGNILIANERAYMLRRMYDLDRAALPSIAVAALESLLRSHGALAAFYDIVARHEAAIPGEPWAKPFPEYAIADARKTVRAYTPKYFETDVAAGLNQVEKTAPPGAVPRGPVEAAPNVPPPPLALPAVPDELRSYQKLLAAGYNALWGTFREGERRVPDRAEWDEAAQKFGAAVAPLLGWLEAVKDQKRS